VAAAASENRIACPGFAVSLRRDEVTHPLPGDDQRLAARRLEVGTQPADADSDILGLRLVPAAPGLAQQVTARPRLSPVDGELEQQRELGGGEVHLRASELHLLARQADPRIADGDVASAVPRGPPRWAGSGAAWRKSAPAGPRCRTAWSRSRPRPYSGRRPCPAPRPARRPR
jgi:hypothetical protein